MSGDDLGLPEAVDRVLSGFVAATRDALGDQLRSIVLYGSAAEGRLRKTSDVNLIVVLTAFDPARVDALREPLRTAHAAIQLDAMFLLEREVPAAVEAFAVKFADILHRRRVLHGPDPFAAVAPSRAAELDRLAQLVLDLILRLRRQYLLRSLRDEQSAALVADTAGPLRICAEALLELQGRTPASPKAALEAFVATLPEAGWDLVLNYLSEARETGSLPPEVGPQTILRLIELAEEMHREVEKVRGAGTP